MIESAGFRDIIEAEEISEKTLRFRRVAEKTDWQVFNYVLPVADRESERTEQVRSRVESVGGYSERVLGGWLFIFLPPNIRWDPTGDLITPTPERRDSATTKSPRFARNQIYLSMIVITALLVYLAPHFVLSRLSEPKVAAAWGVADVYVYAPFDPAAGYDGRDERVHSLLRTVYFPVWTIDHALGGPEPLGSLPLLGVN